MAAIALISLGFFAVILYFSKPKAFDDTKPFLYGKFIFAALLLGGFFLRLFLALNTEGFAVDMGTFKAWGSLVCDVGFSNTYSQGVFLDYPPGYLYVLALLENIRRWLSLSFDSPVFVLICKLPAMLADIACGAILFGFAKNKTGQRMALLICGAYLLCPAVLLNSAVWGQIDSFCTLLLISALLLLYSGRAGAGGAIYAMAVLCKPQMLVFAPVFFLLPIFNRSYKQLIKGILCAIGTAFIIALPFGINQEPLWIFKLYSSTLASYACYSVNAYNVWALAGKNWLALPSSGLGTLISVLGILAAAALCAAVMWRGKQKRGTVFLSSAAIMSVLYIVGVKMHERYIFPVLLCLLFAYAIFNEARLLRAFGALAAANALNVAHVLYIFTKQGGVYDANSLQVKIMSAAQVLALCYVLYSIVFVCFPSASKYCKKIFSLLCKPSNGGNLQKRKVKYADFAVLSAIIIVYSAFVFWNLGSRSTALTPWLPQQNESVTISVQNPASSLWYLPGIAADKSGTRPRVGADVLIETSADGNAWTEIGPPEDGGGAVFTWCKKALPENTRFVRLTAQSESVVLNEIGLRDYNNRLMSVQAVQGNCGFLLDEQQEVPQYRTHENSMYFDEIYHARTAYEHLQGLEPYENTHPPLGKLIIAFGIKLFGMNPFGWRFMGALCGVLMLPVFYHLLKQLLKSTAICGAATFLFAFDFMHFTQTRIATIDTYAVLFILIMYDAMVVFLRQDLQSASIKSLLVPLLASGVSMGLGFAAKWTAAYGAIGLAVLFFAKLLYTLYLQKDNQLRRRLTRRCIIICLWCCLFFVLIPFAIYFAAFLPILLLSHQTDNLWQAFWRYQNNMLSYHARLTEPHPYSSQWYEWPLSLRPMWYYLSSPANAKGDYATIAAFGSPVLWWPCAAAMLYAAWRAVFRRCKAGTVLLIGFLSVYLPWALVPRSMFIYHYFPAVPFLIGALGLAMQHLIKAPILKNKLVSIRGGAVTIGGAVLICYAVLNMVMFVLFFPVLSGMPAAVETVEKLRWLPRWYF